MDENLLLKNLDLAEVLNTEAKVDYFIKTINGINSELSSKGLFNIEYYLLMISTNISKDLSIKSYLDLKNTIIEHINKYLLSNSNIYVDIYNDPELLTLFTGYFTKMIEYYNKTYMLGQSRFNDYVSIEEGNLKINENIDSLRYKVDDIQNTMHLLNEALRIYYEIYNKRVIIATFSDEQEIQFKIKESELAHLLGLKLQNIMNDDKLADALHLNEIEKTILLLIKLNDSSRKKIQNIERKIRHELKKDNPDANKLQLWQDSINVLKKDILNNNNKINELDPNHETNISVLHKFLETQRTGNFLEYEEDRIKKQLKQQDYEEIKFKDDMQSTQFYSKANIKSKAFIKFKPLEELSMLLSFPEGYEFIQSRQEGVNKGLKDPSQYDVLVSKSNLSDQYKYTTLLNNIDKKEDRRYFESLLIKNPEGIQDMEQVQGATPAITTKVILEKEDGSPGTSFESKVRIFSEEEQKSFIREVFQDFERVNFTELIEYFKNLEESCARGTKKQ